MTLKSASVMLWIDDGGTFAEAAASRSSAIATAPVTVITICSSTCTWSRASGLATSTTSPAVPALNRNSFVLLVDGIDRDCELELTAYGRTRSSSRSCAAARLYGFIRVHGYLLAAIGLERNQLPVGSTDTI